MKPRLVALGILVFFARPAYADSDGYFCIGNNYVAYQFGMAAPPVRPHTLFVVRVGEDGTLSKPVQVKLPQFQVHGMRCREDGVDVASFDSIYSVGFQGTGLSDPISIPLKAGQWPGWMKAQRNLGMLARTSEDLLVSELQNRNRVILEIKVMAVPDDVCTARVTSRLTHYSATSTSVRTHIIFNGLAPRECGE